MVTGAAGDELALIDFGLSFFSVTAEDRAVDIHVLEQVLDDRRAMSEFFRVLNSSSGELVISAGLSDNNTTREFGYSNKALSGNRRSYGQDFVARLRESGFGVERLSCELSPTEREKLGIIPEPFFRCTKDQTVRSKYQFPSSAGAAT